MSIKVTVSSGNLAARAEAAAQKAFENAGRELFGAFQQSFTAKAWDWPGQTQRSGGSIVGSPRNLIDIGNLRQSGSWQFTGPYSARYTWSAQYATAVHEGYRRSRADGSYSTWPARPWTHAVLGRMKALGITPFPLQKRIKETWLAYFKASGR